MDTKISRKVLQDLLKLTSQMKQHQLKGKFAPKPPAEPEVEEMPDAELEVTAEPDSKMDMLSQMDPSDLKKLFKK